MKKLILLSLLLTACSHSQTYQQSLQPWVGMPEISLYDSWGRPASEFYVTPQTKVVTYIQTEDKPINGNTRPYSGIEVDYEAIETPDYGENLINNADDNYYCKTSFTITNGEIVNYTFNGDDCVVRE